MRRCLKTIRGVMLCFVIVVLTSGVDVQRSVRPPGCPLSAGLWLASSQNLSSWPKPSHGWGSATQHRENLSGTRCNRRDQLIYRDRSVNATDIQRTVKLHFSAAVSTNICTNKDHFSAAKKNKVEI